MKIIIAGAGEVGTHLAKMLSFENQDITLLDNDQARLDVIDANYNLLTWNGSTSSFQALRDIGVADSDLYIAVTPFETRNIASCAIAKKLGASKTVARIDNSEFLESENSRLLKELGVDFLIYPENLAALEIAKALQHNWTRYWGDLYDGRLILIGVKATNVNPLVNCQIRALPVSTHNFHIVAIKRKSETLIPTGNDYIYEGDILYFATTPPFVNDVREICGKKQKTIRKVMIMGGNRIASRFARLYHDKYHIKILDMDRARCEQLVEWLPDCDIVHADGRDIDTLRENYIYQYDAFLALTSQSETNILACLTAKEFGVSKTVAEVENLQFLSQAENLNIGTTINKKLFASSRIFKILLDADTDSSKCLSLADAEVAEIVVGDDAKIAKKLVKDLHLPYGMTLAGYLRGETCKLIDGNTQLMAGDNVVVLCLSGMLNKVEKWFK